ncbi:hypothetical protein DAETH_02110 [Deinococcus aetherius]|uniref:Uncharacterized protein n=1 Tax=Deinococcus aetherius TaxID=200252 RepID=A0ABN6RA39_9DEIO|nr:hypothetical protein DAETH_02110 [Deinococcus aetherius]
MDALVTPLPASPTRGEEQKDAGALALFKTPIQTPDRHTPHQRSWPTTPPCSRSETVGTPMGRDKIKPYVRKNTSTRAARVPLPSAAPLPLPPRGVGGWGVGVSRIKTPGPSTPTPPSQDELPRANRSSSATPNATPFSKCSRTMFSFGA